MPTPDPTPAPAARASEAARDEAGFPRVLPPAIVLLLGTIAYANALGGGFVFDDVPQIRENACLTDLGRFLAKGCGPPTRWVAYLTFALDYRVGGLHPLGWHVVNVAVHLANALLVYVLATLAFRTPRLRGSPVAAAAPSIAFVAAALFVSHPLQSQAVAYVAQRITSLATTFYLLTIVAYAAFRLREEEAGRATRGGRLAAGVVVFATAALAMRTKEIAFTLPFVVALFELSFFPGTPRERLLRLAPVLATLPIIPATLLLSGAASPGTVAKLAALTRADSPLPRLSYLATQAVVVVKYLRLLLVPVGQNLDHDVAVQGSFLAPASAASAALLLALAAVAVHLVRRAARPGADPGLRLVGFGILWFFLALSVESSLIPITDVMVEHRVYLPSAGLLVAIVTGATLLARRISPARAARAIVIGGTAIALVLTVATIRRNRVWADDVSLWADAVSKSPRKARPLLNLGTALASSGRPEAGARVLRRAVDLDPGSPYARSQLATALLVLGRPAEAEPQLREALRLAPGDPEATYNLATMLWIGNRRDEARRWYRRFLEIAPAAYADARKLASTRVTVE
jgi:hypothetical protein